jgi:multiple sugar transport system substrate-binding protein
MRRHVPSIVVHVVCALFALALIGCSSTHSSQSTAPAAGRDPHSLTIRWAFWGDDWEVAVNQRMARAFELEHPEIKVQMEHHTWSGYFGWLRSEWRAGRSPDVMFLNYIPSYVALGELEPIDGFLQDNSTLLSDFYPALLSSFRVDGQLYGLPRDNDTKVIYYNRAHFQEAGIPEPREGWTWADLRAAALALTQRESVVPRYGFGFEPSYWWLVWLWQNGGDVVDDPAQPANVQLDSPANVEALQFLQDLIYSDRVTPPATMLNTDDMNALFRDGRLSMVFGNHALVPWFANTPDLDWDVAPLPQQRARANVAGGAGYTISRRSAHKEAAWQLVRFLSGTKAQAILAESGLITPARRSVREDSIFLRQQPYKAAVFLTETEIGRPVPNFPGVTEMERVIDEGLAALWRGERRASEVLRDLAPEVERVLGLHGS